MVAGDADWDPTTYGRVNTLQRFVAEQALAGLTIAGNERVLDVGCGDGQVSELVADRLTTGSLLGVDPAAAMVEAARARLGTRPRVDFAVGSAATLPYTDAFDLVTSFNALHWETRWTLALERIAAALVSPGRAFLVFVCDGARPSLEDVVTETSRTPRWRAAFAGFEPPYVHVDPDAYAGAAGSAGFGVDRLEVADLSWDFGHPAAFRAWCAAGLHAWTSRLPAEHVPGFLDDVGTAYTGVSGSDSTLRFLQCRIGLTR